MFGAEGFLLLLLLFGPSAFASVFCSFACLVICISSVILVCISSNLADFMLSLSTECVFFSFFFHDYLQLVASSRSLCPGNVANQLFSFYVSILVA